MTRHTTQCSPTAETRTRAEGPARSLSDGEARRFTTRPRDADLVAALLFESGASAVALVEPAPPGRVVLVADVAQWPIRGPLASLLTCEPELEPTIGWSAPSSDVTVGRLRVIAPEPSNADEREGLADHGLLDPIVLEAGHAFGSGSHVTTRLCLLGLQWDADRRRGASPTRASLGGCLDIGTGTGVLAIAAGRVGFDPVAAVENDGGAARVAARNFVSNGTTVALTADVPPDRRWSLVVVNMLSADLAAVAAPVADAVDDGGTLLRGGVTIDELDRLRREYRGWAELWSASESGWAAVAFRRPPLA